MLQDIQIYEDTLNINGAPVTLLANTGFTLEIRCDNAASHCSSFEDRETVDSI